MHCQFGRVQAYSPTAGARQKPPSHGNTGLIIRYVRMIYNTKAIVIERVEIPSYTSIYSRSGEKPRMG